MRTRTYGLDRDTISYANRIKAGSGTVLSNSAIKQINKFVVGIKRMGLWNSMVCWPMRSIHNAGTGSTVYSLGGLGIYNGTMVNSPSWGFEGISSISTLSQRVSITIPEYNGMAPKFQLYASWKYNVTSYTTGVDYLIGNGAGILLAKRRGSTVTGRRNTNASNISTSSPLPNGWHDAQYNCFTTGSQLFLNGALFSSDAYILNQNVNTKDSFLAYSCGSGTGSVIQPIAIFCYGDQINRYYQIRVLYKQTIGQNLGLY